MNEAASSPGRRAKTPRRLLKLVIVAITCLIAAPLAWSVYKKMKRNTAVRGHGVLQVREGNYYSGHERLGYSLTPGVHHIRFAIGGEEGTKFIIVGEDGCKTTSMKLLDDDPRPQLWLAGCSFVAGDALSNQETVAWILQEQFPELRVRNMACSSYGSIHALLRLRQAVADGDPLPRTLVFFHAIWHSERNVAKSTWLASFKRPGTYEDEGSRRYVQAYLDGDRLAVRYVPYGADKQAWTDAIAAPPISGEDAVRVERAIFTEMRELCTEHGVRSIVAVISSQSFPETMSTSTVKHVRDLGFEVLDVSLPAGTPELDAKYQQIPGSDGHPTAAGHRLYAERLLKFLRG